MDTGTSDKKYTTGDQNKHFTGQRVGQSWDFQSLTQVWRNTRATNRIIKIVLPEKNLQTTTVSVTRPTRHSSFV